MKKTSFTYTSTLLVVFGFVFLLIFEKTNFAYADTCVTLSVNMGYRANDVQTKGEVSKLQSFLNKKGFLTVSPNGHFGPMTTAAVKKFQASTGISTTGYIGPLTREKIKILSCVGSGVGKDSVNLATSSYNKIQANSTRLNLANATPTNSNPSHLDIIRGHKFNQDLTIGSRGVDVIALQTFLEAKGYLTMASGNPKGEYDEGTRLSLSYYQTSVGIIPANGVVNAVTRVIINAALSSTPTKIQSITTSTSIQPNTTSTQITPTPNQTINLPVQTNSKADIVITDLTWDPASLTQSYETNIKMTYTLKNIGTEPFKGRGLVCTGERINDINPTEPYPQIGGPCLMDGPGSFTLEPGESKVFQGEHKDISYNYRKKAGPFYLRIKFVPVDYTLESNLYNAYIDKTLIIIPALPLTPTIVSPVEGASIPMNTENTNNRTNNKGEYYAQGAFKVSVTGGIEKANYSSTWVLRNLNTGEVKNYNDVDNAILFYGNEAILYKGFFESGDWSVTATVKDKHGGVDAMMGTSAPLTFKIVPRIP